MYWKFVAMHYLEEYNWSRTLEWNGIEAYYFSWSIISPKSKLLKECTELCSALLLGGIRDWSRTLEWNRSLFILAGVSW
jgi:hypothetical protein